MHQTFLTTPKVNRLKQLHSATATDFCRQTIDSMERNIPGPTNTNKNLKADNEIPALMDTALMDMSLSSDSSQQRQQGVEEPSKRSTTAAVVSYIHQVSRKRQRLLLSTMLCLLMALIASVLAVVLTSDTRKNRNSSVSSLIDGRSDMPTDLLSAVPSRIPSDMPSFVPSDMPSWMPSHVPSSIPTVTPSSSPSAPPSITLSASPTVFHVKSTSIPDNPPSGYFNYDLSDNLYGPNAWRKVQTPNHHWLYELTNEGPSGPFEGLESTEIVKNRCDSREPSKQSPRDLKANLVCEAHHEIRTWCGDHPLTSSTIDAQILPSKLRLQMNRRKCGLVQHEECQEDAPPVMDYPRYSSSLSSYADLKHYDIKIPAEHSIEGESFDAEVQMLTIHPSDARIASVGIVIRANGGKNPAFQQILDEFQKTYDQHKDDCNSHRSNINATIKTAPTTNDTTRYLRATDDIAAQKFLDNHDDPNAPFVRQMKWGGFDPFVDALWPSIYFYRYDGSLTEPPCTGITWFIMEKPIIISVDQLDQMKRLLFTHRDGNCRQTSVHNKDMSVARPMFPFDSQTIIQDCLSGAFTSDTEKGRKPGRRCRA